MLSVRTLVKVYPGPVVALQGIDLDVPNGMFGLLGPNGAGKSTFMKILAGLLEPTSGAATLDGHDILTDPAWVRARLGYLPQDFGFYPHLTGEKMLTYLLRLKGVESPGGIRKLVAELLERVNLSFAAKRKVKEYSGGMRQRLGIAQAVAGNPRVLIVDEPTAGLDPEERHRFYRILSDLASERIVLLSTHIVEDVAVLCRRFAVISRGRLVAETTPAEARRSLAGSLFEGKGTDERLGELRRRYRVTQAILVEGENRLRIHVPDRLAPEGFVPVEPTLEDAYMTLVAGSGDGVPVEGGTPSRVHPGSPASADRSAAATEGRA
jgi:ABC-type multidrug transport system ATPase subunit